MGWKTRSLCASDEIYARIIYTVELHLQAQFIPTWRKRARCDHRRLFEEASPTGWRIGYAVAPPAWPSNWNAGDQHLHTRGGVHASKLAIEELRDRYGRHTKMVAESRAPRAISCVSARPGFGVRNRMARSRMVNSSGTESPRRGLRVCSRQGRSRRHPGALRAVGKRFRRYLAFQCGLARGVRQQT